MALSPGTRLGPYEIQSIIGAGGMGEVYRALDTRLDRIVAIKVLPAQLAADPSHRAAARGNRRRQLSLLGARQSLDRVFADGKLKRLDLAGSAPQVLADAPLALAQYAVASDGRFVMNVDAGG
jgi:serine/threonine protein kinase